MSRPTSIVLSIALCGACCLPDVLAAAKKAERTDGERNALEKVLLLEAREPVDRRTALSAELERVPDSNPLRWQAGYVRDGKGWRAVEDFGAQQDADETLSEYRRQREGASGAAAAQVELADWCHRHKLKDQERAHLSAALERAADKDRPALLKRLGYVSVGQQWLSRDQVAAWKELNRRALAALERWQPQLERIAEQLRGTRRQRQGALANLQKLADAESIPAIEYVLCGRDEDAALQAVAAFEQLTDYEATLALAKQAVFSKWEPVRERARQNLRSRRFEDFVPALNRLLTLPATGIVEAPQVSFRRDNRNGLYAFVMEYGYTIAQETDDQFQVAKLKRIDFRVNEQISTGPRTGGGINGAILQNFAVANTKLTLERQRNDLERAVADEAEKALDESRKRTAELNQRVIATLAAVSTREPSSDVRAWWQWWEEYTDTQRLGPKQVARSAYYETEGQPVGQFESGSFGLRTSAASCFAAGTPVWSERGPLPIEKLRIGDRVLSQNVETGELELKPVLATSLRPARPLVAIETADETILATGGHRFWVPGEGWTKARELQAESRLRTATASLPVVSISDAPAAETYNLVVADFHTYFVGEAKMLVQDLPLPLPTNMIVPGLARRDSAKDQPPQP